jgi:hypothetical protein
MEKARDVEMTGEPTPVCDKNRSFGPLVSHKSARRSITGDVDRDEEHTESDKERPNEEHKYSERFLLLSC